jgi:large repetitive protein
MVSGSEGDDANLYSVTLSLRDGRALLPLGLEVLAYAPTVRVPDKLRLTELRFQVPDNADALSLRNFDAANGNIAFASTYRTVALEASKQNAWRESVLRILPEERGSSAALVVSGGDEIPNDVTLMVADGEGKAVPIRLPARPGRRIPVPFRMPRSRSLRTAVRSRSMLPPRPTPTATGLAIDGSSVMAP